MSHINQFLVDGKPIEPNYVKKKGLVRSRMVGDLLYISGHGCEDGFPGVPLYAGRVGTDYTVEEGYAAARVCAINILEHLHDLYGSFDKVENLVKVFGLVNCGADFNDVELVMDGFSDTMIEVLKERGFHARTVMGTHNLPNQNISVEVELIVSISLN
jgi:enamine deaminase RidA (YjgF/YER057c/UK114 family)